MDTVVVTGFPAILDVVVAVSAAKMVLSTLVIFRTLHSTVTFLTFLTFCALSGSRSAI